MKLRNLIESFVISNDEFEDYLDRATEQLATEIQSGKNPRDAVHDLSVQFSKQHNNAYAAYTRMSDSLFARLHTLELDSSESPEMGMGDEMGMDPMGMGDELGGDMGEDPEMLNDPMGNGMEMDVPAEEEMPMDSEMDDYAAVMDNKPDMEESFTEGWETLPPIDKEKYQERDGLEGPFQTRVGKVVYYDPKEGAYYDPDSDVYLTYDEWKELDGDSPLRNEAEEKFAGWLAITEGRKVRIRKDQAKDIYEARRKAAKHCGMNESEIEVVPAMSQMNESKQLNEFLPLLAPVATALAPHLAGAAARAVGGALVRRGATALAQRGAAALAQRGATGAARAVGGAIRGAKAARTANTVSNVAKGVNTAANVVGALGKAGTSAASKPAASGKDYSTLQPSLSKLNNSKKNDGEQIDEISSDLAKRYKKNAQVDRDINDEILDRDGNTNDQETNAKLHKRNAKRIKGINLANKRIK